MNFAKCYARCLRRFYRDAKTGKKYLKGFDPMAPSPWPSVANIFRGPLRLAARTYNALPLPHHLRHLINLALLGKLHFLTRHVLHAMAPATGVGLARALVRLAEANRAKVAPQPDFAYAEHPDISIVISVGNKGLGTSLCLQSIAESGTRRSFEILIVDDAPGSRNRGAGEARGRLLQFLSADTWVVPGWLDALADSLEGSGNAGLVGSKLVYPDGRLQEAGGIIWDDATGSACGRGQDPDHPEFNYLREVDYCSATSVVIPRELFHRLGGFDERYGGTSYEDADLAFAVRAANLRVLYQPTSEVIHFDHEASGRDAMHGLKGQDSANRRKFLDKWSGVLAHDRNPGEMPHLEKERTVRRRALVIDIRTPMPDKDSGSLDTLNYIRALQGFGFKVTFIPADDLSAAGPYTSELQKTGVKCLHRPHLTSIKAHLAERGQEYGLVLLSRAHNAARLIDDVRRCCPNARIVFNAVDLHFLREQRQAKLEGSSALARAAARTRELELRTIRLADATILLSSVEHELLMRDVPDAALFVIPLFRAIPGRSAAFAQRRDILFIGGYRHLPNVDAVRYFVSEIWPLVRQRLPEAVFLILGSDPPAEILALKAEGIVVAGYVEDVAPYFNRCRLSVAPLRYGAGIKGKIVTSLSFGVPCVATQIAVEGMGLTNGDEAVVADSPQAFADAVARLYTDESVWLSLSSQGLEFVERNFSLAAGQRRLRSMLVRLNVLP